MNGQTVFNLNIFFDESGKNSSDRPHLMGALAIPEEIYLRSEIEDLNQIIRNKKLHWVDYKGDSRERNTIWKIIKQMMNYQELIKMNVFNYDQTIIKMNARDFTDVDPSLFFSSIYMKLPERIVYGLLRKFGTHLQVNTHIFIEDAEEYRKKEVQLAETLPKQLNVQAIYRGENYKIKSSKYVPKQQQVGLETIDLLLGMIRTIIKNSGFNNSEGSRKNREQVSLVIKLLKDSNFHSFLKNIKYYEWSNTYELNELDFNNYLNHL
ncbi:hypothetical protein AJ85_19010 [Alkalihalobacillus alcalophilus ATCC 27647 = CGMCC 1.3604]|uniref:DUF3800 domain-containing protein n=1 Tax=Alkalihalobacillus alcalophilus ATCC 27647 = CGMCC 1.3604 TaxID=1218173 RepID=A0A094WSE0_ALKAL|nr:DUF3800 domain-containing protein [Alkalihalobacillus alcalophilus]KGA98983.1 hypothetical protein BALCAV_0201690 [Alkalihalobacillus alcalophilus ATCC 27647 = CGMCC 1.3604]MED1562025.1 DUF3800 domain-containing protein [Alkalihalobacillus alcalophilus]THG89201.1 hypothetical protein AJ85_19010 [Alkalihalobacillus alcalophilus ATCC 27647 = CGMCC 1.3604]